LFGKVLLTTVRCGVLRLQALRADPALLEQPSGSEKLRFRVSRIRAENGTVPGADPADDELDVGHT
jgi:hypothetical protein